MKPKRNTFDGVYIDWMNGDIKKVTSEWNNLSSFHQSALIAYFSYVMDVNITDFMIAICTCQTQMNAS